MSAMAFDALLPEQLTVNSVDLRGPMCLVLDLSRLWVPKSTWENRVASGVTGSTALAGIQDELVTSIPFWLTGAVDWEGNPYDDFYVGFRRNWRYLANNVFLPSGDATYPAVYTSPDTDEGDIDFEIQIHEPRIESRWPCTWTGELEVCLPGGAL